ncbi:hypothetical protein V8J88_19400 [Massilia sp. W12]|uniref:M61 family metallopeptidase n=1 Tax=Massilia sp. W12 TaxID=3126507 RepID=UPI0030CF9647
MKKILLPLGLFCTLSSSVWAWDQKPNHYQVNIDPQAKLAHVQANLWLDGDELAMFAVSPTPQLKNGQAEFIKNLQVRDQSGALLALQDKGEGEYQVKGDQRVILTYQVKLNHDDYDWPAGKEEVLYHTGEGMLASGYSLFLAPGKKMHGETRVDFALPSGWQAHTPWRGNGGHSFTAQSRRELLNNVMFFGTARAEDISAGGIKIKLVMGKQYWPQRQVFVELIEKQMQTYLQMFGKAPLGERFMLVINQGDSGDGGAFSGSFSQYLKGHGDLASRPVWGRVVAHELLHFWNGLSLTPRDGNEEWFKEGVTDYLTISTMSKNGLLSRDFVRQFLENLPRGQVAARRLMGLKGTVRQAYQDKHRNWLLVYGGGSIAALAMDVKLREASQGKSGLPELMRALYAEFGQAGKSYTLDDLLRVARQHSGLDLGPLLHPIISQEGIPDLHDLYARIGLQLEQYGMLENYLLPKNGPGQAMFAQIFGAPY